MIKRAVDEQQIPPGTLTLGTDNGSAFTARSTRLAISALGVTHRRGGYRDPEIAGVHRELVSLPEGALRLAQRVRDARPGQGGDRRLHRPLPRPAAQHGSTTRRRARCAQRGTMHKSLQKPRPEPSTRKGSGPDTEAHTLSPPHARPQPNLHSHHRHPRTLRRPSTASRSHEPTARPCRLERRSTQMSQPSPVPSAAEPTTPSTQPPTQPSSAQPGQSLSTSQSDKAKTT